MSLSPIRLTPGMDNDTMVNAINNALDQIVAENRTKIIKDENGQNRILIGRAPKGNYVIAISRPGIDVINALEK